MADIFSTLPHDIILLIISHLNAPQPLFIPNYAAAETHLEDNNANLVDISQSLYGSRSHKQIQAAEALISWSSTCHSFRDLLGPLCFSCIVMRAKPRSMASIQALQRGKWWTYVREIVFAGVYTVPSSYVDREEDTGETAANDQASEQDYNPSEDEIAQPRKNLARVDFEQLGKILADLPPLLESLTLDFPTAWWDEMDDDYLTVFIPESARLLTRRERWNPWRKLMKVVLESVSSQDNIDQLAKRIKETERYGGAKFKFDFRLNNLPPFPVSVYPGSLALPCSSEYGFNAYGDQGSEVESFDEPKMTPTQARFAELLGFCSSFTIACDHWNNGAGWAMSSHYSVSTYCAAMPTYLFSHLSSRCRRLELCSDPSWMLGIKEIMSGLDERPSFPLTSSLIDQKCPGLSIGALANVRDVILRTCWIGSDMLDFFEKRSSVVENIVFEDCVATRHNYWRDNNPDELRLGWSFFLDDIARLQMPNIQSFEISYTLKGISPPKRFCSARVCKKNAQKILFESWSSTEENEDTIKSDDNDKDQSDEKYGKKNMFGYSEYDEKYGDSHVNEADQVERFERGEDWKSWIAVCKMMEKMTRRRHQEVATA